MNITKAVVASGFFTMAIVFWTPVMIKCPIKREKVALGATGAFLVFVGCACLFE